MKKDKQAIYNAIDAIKRDTEISVGLRNDMLKFLKSIIVTNKKKVNANKIK
jgi:hypothetical protein